MLTKCSSADPGDETERKQEHSVSHQALVSSCMAHMRLPSDRER